MPTFVGQQAAALGADRVERQQRRAGDMQPLCLGADAKAGLVHVFDRRADDVITDRINQVFQPLGAGAAHRRDGRRGKLYGQQIGHEGDQTRLGQQLIV